MDINEIEALRNKRVGEIIKEMSRLKYGRDARLVESEMTRRSNL